MFTFSFPCPDSIQNHSKTGSDERGSSTGSQWFDAERVTISSENFNCLPMNPETLLSVQLNDFKVFYQSADEALKRCTNLPNASNIVQHAEALHSDLIPAKYEGGLKVWECTIDLLHWLSKGDHSMDFAGKRVLDLGCGAGLLGITALKYGATVLFQDYNREVIEGFTIPNLLCNLSQEECDSLNNTCESCDKICEFYCGDWSNFASLIGIDGQENSKFDFILSSETIYNPENYKKLLNIFKKCLKESGVVYLAAKTYYFGVGGSLRQFESLVEADGLMKSEVLWKCSSGVQREILKITFSMEA